MKQHIYFYSTLIVTLSVLILLITGSFLLATVIPGTSIPLGTLLTWAGMISLPLTLYWGIKELREPSTKGNTILSKFLRILITFGILWVPISYLLSGNFSFTFSEKETFQGGQMAMRWFWYLSYGIGVGTILTLILYWMLSVWNKKDTRNNV